MPGLGLWVLAGCLLAGGQAYYFEPGYAHHYTYKAVNSMMDHRNVTTILKVRLSVKIETNYCSPA